MKSTIVRVNTVIAIAVLLAPVSALCANVNSAGEGEAAPEIHTTVEPGDSGSETEQSSSRGDGQFGAGLVAGVLPGIKIRPTFCFDGGTADGGFLLGGDIDVGTLILVTTVTASAVVGWQFPSGFRLYATVGGGLLHKTGFMESPEDPDVAIARLCGGFEWRFLRWFGLGIEGGVNTDFREKQTYHQEFGGGSSTKTESSTLPYFGLTIMFYSG